MIDLIWSSDTTQDPFLLADAIELTVAFASENYHRFTRADFQHAVDSENLSDDDSSYLDGDVADERVEHFEQALDLIRKRASWLGDSYPFTVKADEVQLVADSLESGYTSTYLFLLLCSNQNFAPSIKSILPACFEDLCKEALRSLFPEWAEVLLFSQNSEDRKNVFGWAASDAIPALAKKLNTIVVNQGGISNTQREYGIDIIAICSFDDQSPYPFFAFAQCTLQQDWWEKRHEATSGNGVAAFIHMNVNHSNLLMIPYFPRHGLEKWSEDPSRTGNCILCDRYRICWLLEKSRSFDINSLPVRLREILQRIQSALPEVSLG